MKKWLIIICTLLLSLIYGCIGTTSITTTESSHESSTSSTASTTATTLNTSALTTTTSGLSTYTTTTSALSTDTATTTAASEIQPLTQNEVDSFKDENVAFSIVHGLSTSQTILFDQYITAFEELYPNVDIQSQKSDSRSAFYLFANALSGGQPIEIALINSSYLSSLQEYNLEDLNKYAYSTASIADQQVGIDLAKLEADFFTHSDQASETSLYSIPFYRESKIVYANRVMLKNAVTEIRSLGYTISDQGFLSREYQYTYDDMSVLSSLFSDKEMLMMEIDEASFETYIYQMNSSYIQQFDYVFDENKSVSLINYFRYLNSVQALTVPEVYDYSYASQFFTDQEIVMAESGGSSLNYFIGGLTPMNNDDTYEVDIFSQIQLTRGTQTDSLVDTYISDLSTGTVFTGFDFAICNDSSNAEKFFSWLFIQYINEMERNIDFCVNFNYFPIYEQSTMISESQTYSDILDLADEYLTSDGSPSWDLSDEKWSSVFKGLIQNAYLGNAQNIYKRECSNQLANTINSNNSLIEDMMITIFNDNTNPVTMIQDLLNELY